VGWRNLFSFPVVLLCQFFVQAGHRLWFYILLMYLEYHTVVVLCLVFLVLAGNSYRCFIHMVLIIQYSCAVVSVFGSGGKYTLLLYIPLLALTDRINEGESNTLAARELEEVFFQLCCCVSFWFWREIGFGFTHLEYNTVAVLCQFFWFWREIVFGTYVLHTVVVLC
jgi:hypothetical protein